MTHRINSRTGTTSWAFEAPRNISRADPPSIPVTGNAVVGSTTISWIAGDVDSVEVHIGSPNGRLVAGGGNRGSSQTGLWVTDGMTFYLQDVTDGRPLTAENTLAILVVSLKK